MPKPSPIVPAPAPKPKKPKKELKRSRDEDNEEAPPPGLVAATSAVTSSPSGDAAAAAAPKAKKKKKAHQQLQQDKEPSSTDRAWGIETAPEIAEMLETVHDDRAFIGQTGPEIASMPDRSDKALKFLAWLVGPVSAETFLKEIYGRRPLHVARSDRTYYDGWFSRAEMERQIRQGGLRWTDEVDAARYEGGVRTTHNGEGIATPEEVWKRYAEGCSIRFSWPQRRSDPLWRMLSQLEELFGCMAGANAYLTPAGSQGFAPHWDDIDALVLQLEGTKEWRVYAPRTSDETLPRFSSPNLLPDELGRLIGQVTLRPGDLLYLPRGFVHQAAAQTHPSLHVTASLGRQHTWRDLLEFGVFGAMESLTVAQPSWRETLPPDLFDRIGLLHANDEEGDAAAAAAHAAATAAEDAANGHLPFDPAELERARVAFGLPPAGNCH